MAATTENKPLYAIAGVAEAAVEVLRSIPNRLVEAASDTSFRDQVKAKVSELPEDAKTWRTDAGELVESLPSKAHEFPGRMSELLANVSHDAGKAYDDMAVRGEGVVAKLRSEYGPKLDEVVDTVKSRVAKASDDVQDNVTALRGKAADVVEDVAEKIDDEPAAVKPAVAKPATKPAAKPATKRATKPATAATPAAKKAPAKKAPAAKPAAPKTGDA